MLEVCNVEYRVCPPNRDVPYLWLGEAGWRKQGCWPCGIGSLGRRNLCAAAPAAHQDAHGLPLKGRTAALCVRLFAVVHVYVRADVCVCNVCCCTCCTPRRTRPASKGENSGPVCVCVCLCLFAVVRVCVCVWKYVCVLYV